MHRITVILQPNRSADMRATAVAVNNRASNNRTRPSRVGD